MILIYFNFNFFYLRSAFFSLFISHCDYDNKYNHMLLFVSSVVALLWICDVVYLPILIIYYMPRDTWQYIDIINMQTTQLLPYNIYRSLIIIQHVASYRQKSVNFQKQTFKVLDGYIGAVLEQSEHGIPIRCFLIKLLLYYSNVYVWHSASVFRIPTHFNYDVVNVEILK